MNKYQQIILDKCSFAIDNEAAVSIDGDTLNIRQCANAYITKFTLSINTIALKSVTVNKEEIVIKGKVINIPIDFEKPIKQISLNPVGDIAEPFVLEVLFIASDKEVYDETVKKRRAKEYKDNLNAHLVKNIFGSPVVIFNPCCEDYSYTEAEFIATNANGTKESVFPRERPVVIGQNSYTERNPEEERTINVILQRKRNEEGCNYIQFINIGECGLKVHIYQYDKKGQLLIDVLVE